MSTYRQVIQNSYEQAIENSLLTLRNWEKAGRPTCGPIYEDMMKAEREYDNTPIPMW